MVHKGRAIQHQGHIDLDDSKPQGVKTTQKC